MILKLSHNQVRVNLIFGHSSNILEPTADNCPIKFLHIPSEATVRFELTHKRFADASLNRLGTSPYLRPTLNSVSVFVKPTHIRYHTANRKLGNLDLFSLSTDPTHPIRHSLPWVPSPSYCRRSSEPGINTLYRVRWPLGGERRNRTSDRC